MGWGKHIWRYLLGASVVGCFALHAAGWLAIPGLQRVEWMIHDLRIRLIAPQTLDERVVIVDIDERSLLPLDRGGEGHWPWPRNRLAVLITQLVESHQASLVGVDIILSEPDRSSGLGVLEQLAREQLRDNKAFQSQLTALRPSLSYDRLMAQAILGKPVVLGYAFHNDETSPNALLPGGLDPNSWDVRTPKVHSYPGYTGVLPELGAAASATGHINPLRDPDGVIRRVPVLIENGGKYYPALVVSMVQQLLGEAELRLVASKYSNGDHRVEGLQIGPVTVPVDGSLNAIVPFRSQPRSYPTVSAADVLQGRVATDRLKNKIIIVGASAAGLSDLVATPVGVGIPGAEVHANLLTAILDERVARTPAWASGADIMSVLLVGAILLGLAGNRGPVASILIFAACGVAIIGFNVYSLANAHLLLPLATPLACLVCLFLLTMSYGFLVESRGKRQMSALFAHYVPPELVDRMAENPQAYSMTPIERELTVLFADIRNFTSISERLSPQELGKLMDTVLGAQSEVIRHQYQGTLDKYIGDAVMAFWGAPVMDPDHAHHAVEAACAMVRAVRDVDLLGRSRGWPPIQIGVGINTGRVHVGDMGSKVRQAYTVLGDPVNLASRLEGLTKMYGVDILVGPTTRVAMDDWVFREIDRVQVKGKEEAVTLWEPIGPRGSVSPDILADLAAWSEVLTAYGKRDWHRAYELLQNLAHKDRNMRLYEVYLRRLSEFQVRPPPESWNGATRLSS